MTPLAVEIDPIADAQQSLWPQSIIPRTRREYRRCARWWQLEALRGYPSSADSLRYATNMFARADLTRFVAKRGGQLEATPLIAAVGGGVSES